nr:MAG: hypothetical protein DIU80_03815 [Chloroflexota bacterium]
MLSGHSYTVKDLSFNGSKGILVSGSRDKSVIVWDASSGEIIARLNGHRSGVMSVAVSSNGALLATIRGSQQSSNLAFHPLHPLLASGGHRQGVLIWNIPQGSLLAQLEGHTAIVRAVAFSPDGALLATISGSEGFLRMSVQILF